MNNDKRWRSEKSKEGPKLQSSAEEITLCWEAVGASHTVLWASGQNRGMNIHLADILSVHFSLFWSSWASIALCIVIFISLGTLYSLCHVICYGSQKILVGPTCWTNMMKTVCLCCVELKPSPRLGKLFSCEFTSFERCGVHPALTSCFSCTFFLGGSILRVWTAGSQVLREEKLVRGVCWWSAGWGEPVRRAEWHSAPLAWPKCPVHRGLCDPHKLGTLGRWFPKGTLSICIPFLACLILPVHGVAMYFINYGAECYLVK